ncbi:alpha/beta fold hydrolase [Pseudorhodoplanes sinuspersici]|uniref:alpha/beta fold hydrolase n=1 Tax=Pseudorhodoplanes sinuspersici TaxID=1235591 RepID=UPI000FF666BE|nr:alpha/beta hydrolase [Pseudorhodoplanes sinuspersici]RKE70789.1 N-formylmaleamate deformylase [Pseudorhodoplanes sinuspersici]
MTSTFQYGANIRANGIRQHFLRYGGAGRNVVILPGITSPSITWGFVGERFGRNFDTYILDARGRGLSETGDGLDYSLDAMAADAAAFVTALDLEDYVFVGHSMGARIALRAVSRHGAKPGAMVMVDPPVSGPGRRHYPAKLPWYVDSIRLSREGCDQEAIRPFCPTWSDEQLRLRAEWLHTCHEGAIVTAFEAFKTDDIHSDFSRISCPSMMMVAGRAGVILPEDEKEISTLQPALRIVKVENAGHMIPWDDEEGFYRAFGDFLGRAV